MNRFIKYSLVTLIVIISIAGLFITAVTFYNANVYKPLITQWVKDNKQRELTFDGDIKFTLYPQFGINISQLSLSEYNSDKIFSRIQNIQLSLALWSLIKSQLVIDKLTIQGLDATLIRFSDGRTNIDDLLITDDDSPDYQFNIKQLHIDDVALFFLDDHDLREHKISNLTLMADKIANTSLKNLQLHALGTTKQVNNNQPNHFEVKLDIPSLQFAANHITSDQILLITKISHLENHINGAFTLSNIASTHNHFTSDTINIELVAESNAHIIQLFLNSPLRGDFDSQALELSNLELNLRLFQPRLPEAPIRGDFLGELYFSNKSTEHLQTNFSGNLEDSQIKAAFDINDFDNPTLQFEIDIDQFNMNRYLPASQQAQQPIKHSKDPANRNNVSMDLASLTDLNANGTIHIGLFQSNDISLSSVQFNIQTNNDQLPTN